MYVFEKEQNSPTEVIKTYIENVKEQFDLDKLIAQEELEIESAQLQRKSDPKNEVEQIYENFLATRGRKWASSCLMLS